MIRNIFLTVPSFIGNYLPLNKRGVLRLKFLKVIYSVFETLAYELKIWSTVAITKAYITGETASMEWAIESYFDTIYGTGFGIVIIETAGPSGVSAGIETIVGELPVFIAAGIQASEPTDFYPVGLPGEDTDFGTKTFIVKIPAMLSSPWDEAEVISIVNTYRAAGKTFKIVYY